MSAYRGSARGGLGYRTSLLDCSSRGRKRGRGEGFPLIKRLKVKMSRGGEMMMMEKVDGDVWCFMCLCPLSSFFKEDKAR